MKSETCPKINISRLGPTARNLLDLNIRALTLEALVQYVWDEGDELGLKIAQRMWDLLPKVPGFKFKK